MSSSSSSYEIDREEHRPENRVAAALVSLLAATEALTILASREDIRQLLAREEHDTGEIALARNQLNRVLDRLDVAMRRP